VVDVPLCACLLERRTFQNFTPPLSDDMNRIQSMLDDELGVSLLLPASAAHVISEPEGELDGCHCIFTPLHYERNYAYPLIVWLHGPDDDERQVTRVMPLVSSRNYVAVGPRGTLPGELPDSYRWRQDRAHIALAEQRVLSAVAAARRWLNIGPSRIYLAGYDCGGTMAFRIALNSPHLFAGVLSVAGPFPTTLRPLAQVHAARGLPVFLATGRDSVKYPEAEVCDTLRLFHAAGMSVCLRQYPCGDDLMTNMLSDMDCWIMEQLVPQPAPCDEASHRSGGK
jgi:phospholipase/carboxylesterase